MGLPVSVFSSAAGPEELQYVPADAAVVAYANVRDVMNSQFRQRFKDLEPSENDKNQFEEKTGLNLEQDVDSVVAAVMPKDGMANNPAGSFLILARARYQASRLEALAIEHGAEVTEYQGKRLITHHDSDSTRSDTTTTWRSASSKRTSSAFGSIDIGEGRDRRARLEPQHRLEQRHDEARERDRQRQRVGGRQVRRDREQGRHPELRLPRRCRASRGSRRRVTSTAASAARSRPKRRTRQRRKNLRDVMGGFLAMAKMQAGNKPGMQQLADSLVISGEGNTVALAFSIPTEVLDVLEGLAKGRHPQLQ